MQTEQSNDFLIRCRKFTIDIINLSALLPHNSVGWAIKDQVVRSAASVGANVAESKGSTSKAEFRRFLAIALRSANETKYWLDIIQDAGLVNNELLGLLTNEVVQISKVLGASVITLNNR